MHYESLAFLVVSALIIITAEENPKKKEQFSPLDEIFTLETYTKNLNYKSFVLHVFW